MSAFEVKINGVDKLTKFLESRGKVYKDEVKEEFKDAARIIKGEMQRDAPVDVGRLKNSVSIVPRNDLAVEIVAPVGYAPYMEWGTKSKAKIPSELQSYASQFRGPTGISDTDPLIALTAWVRRKGLAATYDIKSRNIITRAGKRTRRNKGEAKREKTIAWLIFRKIRKFGVKPHPFFFYTPGGQSRMEKAKKLIIDKLKNIANK
jgi:hypothetical protein